MGLRINNNLASLNASLNLGRANKMLSNSLARLSTGLKINNASDGPADLIISEKFRSQINGISKSIENTQNAISMLSTAEGALNEVNALLTKMKGLALKASQSGTQDPDEIAASQAEIDAAITSINTISRNTAFGSKNLLDGSLQVDTAGVNTSNILVDIDRANFAGDSKDVSIQVVTAATRAATDIDLSNQTTAGTLDSKQVLKVTGNRGSSTITFAAGSTDADIVEEINSQVGQTGVVATVSNNVITLESAKYGASEFVTVEDVDGDNDVLRTNDLTSTAGTITVIPNSSRVYRFNDQANTGVDLTVTEAFKDYTLNVEVVGTANTAAAVSVDTAQKVITVDVGSGVTNAVIAAALNAQVTGTGFGAATTASTVTNAAAPTASTAVTGTLETVPLIVSLREDATATSFNFSIAVAANQSNTAAAVTWAGGTLTVTLGESSNALASLTQTQLTMAIERNTADSATIKSLFQFELSSDTAMAGRSYTAGTHTANTIAAVGTLTSATVLTSFVSESGTDGALEVNGVQTSANNLSYTFDNGNIRGSITIAESFNTVGNQETFTLAGKGAFLQLGQKAQLSHQLGVAIKSVAADQLATGLYLDTSLDPTSASVNNDSTLYTTATLADIISGGEFDLATNAETAFDIIERAILEVSVQRSKLGALISNTLESNINSLGVSFENLTAAESRIRDVDFAAETAEFTRAQILVQAGTSIAAQANVATQAALQLLG